MPTQDELNDEAQVVYIAQNIFIRYCHKSTIVEKAVEISFKAAEAFADERKARWRKLNGSK